MNYTCNDCEYTTCIRLRYESHCATQKHINNVNRNQSAEPEIKPFPCKNCHKSYSTNHGLWYHKKKCVSRVVTQPTNVEQKLDRIIQRLDGLPLEPSLHTEPPYPFPVRSSPERKREFEEEFANQTNHDMVRLQNMNEFLTRHLIFFCCTSTEGSSASTMFENIREIERQNDTEGAMYRETREDTPEEAMNMCQQIEFYTKMQLDDIYRIYTTSRPKRIRLKNLIRWAELYEHRYGVFVDILKSLLMSQREDFESLLRIQHPPRYTKRDVEERHRLSLIEIARLNLPSECLERMRGIQCPLTTEPPVLYDEEDV